MLQMAVRPHIIHVVGYSEAEFAATPEVVIESCRIARGVIRSVLQGGADMTCDPAVQARKDELIGEAKYLIDFICSYYRHKSDDPLTDPEVLSDCIRRGIIDAPHIVKNDKFRGLLQTRVIDGKCLAWNPQTSSVMDEHARLQLLRKEGRI